MATHRRRITALQALVAGSPLSGTANETTVNDEFDLVVRSGYVRITIRRYLLQMLHSTRALDTALAAFLSHHGINPNVSSLGGYLHALANHGNPGLSTLPQLRRQRFQNNIVAIRNHYLHAAGSVPANDAAIAAIVAEMEVCLMEVFNL